MKFKNLLSTLLIFVSFTANAQTIDSTHNNNLSTPPATQADRETIKVFPGYSGSASIFLPNDTVPIEISGSQCRTVNYTIYHSFSAPIYNVNNLYQSPCYGANCVASGRQTGFGKPLGFATFQWRVNSGVGPNLSRKICTQTCHDWCDENCHYVYDYNSFSGTTNICPGQTGITFNGPNAPNRLAIIGYKVN